VRQPEWDGLEIIAVYFIIIICEKQNLIYSTKNLHLNKVSAIFWGMSDASTLVQYLITMTTSIFLLINKPGIIRASDIVAIMMLLSSYIWPVRSLGRIVSDLGKCNVAAGRVKEILDLKSEYVMDSSFQPEIQGKIEFSNVSFQFDGLQLTVGEVEVDVVSLHHDSVPIIGMGDIGGGTDSGRGQDGQ